MYRLDCGVRADMLCWGGGWRCLAAAAVTGPTDVPQGATCGCQAAYAMRLCLAVAARLWLAGAVRGALADREQSTWTGADKMQCEHATVSMCVHGQWSPRELARPLTLGPPGSCQRTCGVHTGSAGQVATVVWCPNASLGQLGRCLLVAGPRRGGGCQGRGLGASGPAAS
jgi:hypothetical protein